MYIYPPKGELQQTNGLVISEKGKNTEQNAQVRGEIPLCASWPLRRTSYILLVWGMGGGSLCAVDSLAMSLGVKPKDVM